MNQTKAKSDPALQWAVDYLTKNHGGSIANYHRIVETAWSTVYQISISDNTFYLKKTPPQLFTEVRTITWLRNQGTTSIPVLVVENESLCCFLMLSCGDVALRDHFSGKVRADLLVQGVMHYTNIQRTLECNIPEMQSLNLPDWRLKQIPLLYQDLIAREDLLLEDGLSIEEITELHIALDTCRTLCTSLSDYQIPETLNHCDFHENNMVLEKKTNRISLIDWGEAVISHPFFSLSGCLWNLTYFYEMQASDAIYASLRRQFISPWINLHPAEELLRALAISDKLLGIFAALGYQHMYDATMSQPRAVQAERPGSIAGCLRSFLRESRIP
ncbi:MAG: aminoglycoside phosphotransferase family protein [Gammaproteobacteria bacterium]|jgi:hypothetical protein|nr:aminoglycoside phosphotransferase family protein [Gammaproteobacteria bacterium]